MDTNNESPPYVFVLTFPRLGKENTNIGVEDDA